ncbi:MAG: sensor histidine kinase [Desulfatiglandales bacterium]
MWNPINLRVRIYAVLTVMVLITLLGGLIMVWYTYRMEGLLSYLIDQNIAAFQAADSLESSLSYQKGFVSYYYQDGDPDWLKALGEYRQITRQRLDEARSFTESIGKKDFIEKIESDYANYIHLQDQVIDLYKKGQGELALEIHKDARDSYFRILEYCRDYRDFYKGRIMEVRDQSQQQARKLRIIAGTAILIVLFLAVLLAFVLVNNILGPVRRLALEADREAGLGHSDDDVKALRRSVRGLLEDVDHTHIELEKSREHLLQAEKMAMVGKLAAGMAHSVRNPLTSVKMRLFSLSRTLELTSDQKEDFDVISEEINHTDTIVQNFLEFSRPPKLKMQRISPSEVVDMVIQLLRYRLESYDVVIEVHRHEPLPEVQADPEQLKEALANLIENACEAMKGTGGTIFIEEEESQSDPARPSVVIRLSDTGPGIPEENAKDVFLPFFTTKEEGSGLGLSITTRIIEEHGGTLDLISRDQGATFEITLPVKE